jgi:putative N6-adenine-specific DNA methylase
MRVSSSASSEISAPRAWYVSRMQDGLELFAACAPGLEPLLAGELERLGATPREVPGGVEFAGSRELLGCAQRWLGTASHVLRRCAKFRCRALGELERKVAELDPEGWLPPGQPFHVRASARHSRVYHTAAIERHFRAGLARALGDPRQAEDPPRDAELPCYAVRFFSDLCTISLDPAPTPLHRRGYRLAMGKAPLREDLAHALVLASGWRDDEAFLDPFCGSGAIAIEAARLGRGIAPGALRAPVLPEGAPPPSFAPSRTGPLEASDRDELAVEHARANAERAGVSAHLELRCSAFGAHPWLAKPQDAPERGVLVCNPPFGKRVAGGGDLRVLYQSLGHRFQQLGPGWRLVLLAHDLRLARAVGIPLKRLFSTRHGGLAVTALASAPTSA